MPLFLQAPLFSSHQRFWIFLYKNWTLIQTTILNQNCIYMGRENMVIQKWVLSQIKYFCEIISHAKIIFWKLKKKKGGGAHFKSSAIKQLTFSLVWKKRKRVTLHLWHSKTCHISLFSGTPRHGAMVFNIWFKIKLNIKCNWLQQISTS